MEAFKKWQNQRAIKTKGFINPVGYYCFGEEEGWRAALEWALEIDYLYYSDVSLKKVRQELGEE